MTAAGVAVRAALVRERAVRIDDVPRHLRGARAVGIHAARVGVQDPSAGSDRFVLIAGPR
jgi:FMN phosphatase YigB (HAD superfamily)